MRARHGKPYCALGPEVSRNASFRAFVFAADIDDTLLHCLCLFVRRRVVFMIFVVMAFRRNFRAGRMLSDAMLKLLGRRSSSTLMSR